jgi:hypothetical protein
VETVAQIRREHFVKGMTIKEIARDLKMSRNTVRKLSRSEETAFEYEHAVHRGRSWDDGRRHLLRAVRVTMAGSRRVRAVALRQEPVQESTTPRLQVLSVSPIPVPQRRQKPPKCALLSDNRIQAIKPRLHLATGQQRHLEAVARETGKLAP